MSTPYTPRRSSSFKVVSPGIGGDSFSTESNLSRVLPRQNSTGSMRGVTTVGYGNTKIDGTNNTITIGNQSTGFSISLGVIQNSTSGEGVGFSITDSTNFNLFKMDGQTWFWYDPSTKKNVMQVGLLPDGSYGWAVSAPGFNVSDGFS